MVQGQGGRLPSGQRRFDRDLPFVPAESTANGVLEQATISLNEFTPGFLLDGRYSIIEQIGAGGMSVVYKARHLLIDRLVAIKTLHRHLMADSKNLQRFLQEAKTEGAINHPNVVGVQAVGVSPGGQLYIVMDYIDGLPLSAVLQRGPLSKEQAVEVFKQICNGMEAAHERGIVHRDLKPSNIMLSGTEDAPVVHVVDFGIAKLLGAEHNGKRTLTKCGAVMGTPSYMSPEQCRGETLDARSDIYALGCILYETVCAHRAFDGETEFNVMMRQMQESPPPFEHLPGAPEVDRKLQSIIFQALEKKPQHRQASVAVLRDQLLGQSDITEATENGHSKRAASVSRRRFISPKLILPALFVLSVSLSIPFAKPLLHSFQYKLALLNAQLKINSTAGLTANDESRVLSRLQLADLEWKNGETTKALEVYKSVEANLAIVPEAGIDLAIDAANRLYSNPLERANKFAALIAKSANAKSYKNALAFAQVNFKNCAGTGGWPEQYARTTLLQSYIDYSRALWSTKNFDEGFSCAEKAIALMRSDTNVSKEVRRDRICSVLNECGQQYIAARRFNEAQQCFQKALKLDLTFSERLPVTYEGLGDTYYLQNRFYEARDAFMAARDWVLNHPESRMDATTLDKKLYSIEVALKQR